MKTSYKFGEVYTLTRQIESSDERVSFKNVFETENGGVSLLAFKAGQELTTHEAPLEVMVTVLEGEIEFTMLDRKHTLREGEYLLMGAHVPHSVRAVTEAKVMLTKLRD